MRLSSAILLKSTLTTFLIFAMLQTGFARERGPRVEVVCPSPPIAVKLADQRVLVYELHVTNFDVVPLTLKSVEIFGKHRAGYRAASAFSVDRSKLGSGIRGSAVHPAAKK